MNSALLRVAYHEYSVDASRILFDNNICSSRAVFSDLQRLYMFDHDSRPMDTGRQDYSRLRLLLWVLPYHPVVPYLRFVAGL